MLLQMEGTWRSMVPLGMAALLVSNKFCCFNAGAPKFHGRDPARFLVCCWRRSRVLAPDHRALAIAEAAAPNKERG